MNPTLADLAVKADRIFNTELFELAETSVTLASLSIFALMVLFTFKASSWLQRLLRLWFRKRGLDEEGSLGVMQRLLHYAVVVVGLGMALQTVGFELGALFAAGAVFAVGIGFAMQNIAQNFVSGIILLLERTIEPGDVLTVEGRVVRVVRMNIRSTIVRNRDGEELIVPNTILVQSTVTNQTLGDKLVRIRATVGVSYDSDMVAVRRCLEAMATAQPWRSMHEEPLVLMTGFGASSVDWEICVWTQDPWASRRDKSRLLEATWNALRASGITIAYPQLDLHLDPPVIEALGPKLVG
jgi:potassium efflux system protein